MKLTSFKMSELCTSPGSLCLHLLKQYKPLLRTWIMWHAIILGYNWKQDSKASKLCWTYHTYCSLLNLFWIKTLFLTWILSSVFLTQQLVPIWKNTHFWQNSCTVSLGMGEWREPTHVLPQTPLLSGSWGGPREQENLTPHRACGGQADSSPNTQPHQSLPWRQHIYPLFSQGTSSQSTAVPWGPLPQQKDWNCSCDHSQDFLRNIRTCIKPN